MRWMLAGWWGLVLISLSVADNKILQIRQKPRFYGVAVKSSVPIYCLSSRQDNSTVKWFKANKIGDEQTPLSTLIDDNIRFQMAYLYINNIQMRHSGVYYCKINETQGPGTEVKVFRPVAMEKALYRSNVKDGLIVFQGFLLAVFIAAVLLRKQKLWERRDSEYEEPETDHIYEGLAIETCGGGLYEELSVYAQAEGAEAPWE
ncbi:B-cell antigen receptor complex-associated protein beta chain isoform X2 [Simochromis diagramma]|uniref:B-cell antigen receptor complex-associated protein beta chain isoform X2 n=1 Tax=Simochromis diagramma TaxID=43689 RepID=UPI001A7EFF10|nr:B-cell antigen receptor complex-associated protein beta chain isoform X2 [Simochromis diagramma]